LAEEHPETPSATPTHRIEGDASKTNFNYKGQVKGGTGTEYITKEKIPVKEIKKLKE